MVRDNRRAGRLAVTDREYRSQCIRGHIACLETRFVSFPRPPTTNLHCSPLNNFNMAASTGARTASSDISPSLPPEYSDRPAIYSRFTMFAVRTSNSLLLYSVYVIYHGLKQISVEANFKGSTMKRNSLTQKSKSTFAQQSLQ